eukprot:761592_1
MGRVSYAFNMTTKSGLVTMNGRKLLINEAVNKHEAQKMERSKLMMKDRRSLYLENEGIMLTEEQMGAMDKHELDRRIRSWCTSISCTVSWMLILIHFAF